MPFAGLIPLHSLEGTQPIYRNYKYTRPTRRGERRGEGRYQGGVGVPSVIVRAGLFLTMMSSVSPPRPCRPKRKKVVVTAHPPGGPKTPKQPNPLTGTGTLRAKTANIGNFSHSSENFPEPTLNHARNLTTTINVVCGRGLSGDAGWRGPWAAPSF